MKSVSGNWRLQLSAAAAVFAAFVLIISRTTGVLADDLEIDSAQEPTPAIQVHELSQQELHDMGISEKSFQVPRASLWTIPGGPETQGSGGQLPPCPKDMIPTPGPIGPLGPILTLPTPTLTPTPTPTVSGCIPYPNPNPTPTNTWYPDPIPTGGGIIGNVGAGVIILERIVNLGRTIWQFVKDGRAVVNVDMPSASALPAGITAASQLDGWQPMTKNYQVIAPPSGNQRKIEFVFRITMWHSGSYQGHGHFIANLTVQAADYKVNWGQEFNVRARIPNDGLVNVSNTSSDPIAAAQVLVEWSRAKFFSTQGNSAVIYVRGDGQMKNLSAPDDQPEDLYPIGKGSNNRPRR